MPSIDFAKGDHLLVREGDTLAGICERFGRLPSDIGMLLQHNPQIACLPSARVGVGEVTSAPLQPGRLLRLPDAFLATKGAPPPVVLSAPPVGVGDPAASDETRFNELIQYVPPAAQAQYQGMLVGLLKNKSGALAVAVAYTAALKELLAFLHGQSATYDVGFNQLTSANKTLVEKARSVVEAQLEAGQIASGISGNQIFEASRSNTLAFLTYVLEQQTGGMSLGPNPTRANNAQDLADAREYDAYFPLLSPPDQTGIGMTFAHNSTYGVTVEQAKGLTLPALLQKIALMEAAYNKIYVQLTPAHRLTLAKALQATITTFTNAGYPHASVAAAASVLPIAQSLLGAQTLTKTSASGSRAPVVPPRPAGSPCGPAGAGGQIAVDGTLCCPHGVGPNGLCNFLLAGGALSSDPAVISEAKKAGATQDPNDPYHLVGGVPPQVASSAGPLLIGAGIIAVAGTIFYLTTRGGAAAAARGPVGVRRSPAPHRLTAARAR